MYDKNKSFAVTYFAPIEIDNKIIALKESLGIQKYPGEILPSDIVTKNHAHITLKSSFSLREDISETKITNALSRIHFTPFKVKANKHTIFQTKEFGDALVLLTENNVELVHLHNNICESLQDLIYKKNHQSGKEDFSPHISVIYNLADTQKTNAIQMIKKLLPVEFEINKISLLKTKSQTEHTRLLVKEYYAN